MAVKLSRKSGQFSLLLSDVKWLDVSGLAPQLATALGVTRSDAIRALRQQKGILLEGLSETQAKAAQEALGAQGVQTRVAPDAGVPVLSKALEVSLIRIGEHDFETPSVVGAGLPQLWHWENLALACGGIILDAQAQADNLSTPLEKGLYEEADVRKAHARRHLEKTRERAFPLAAEIRRPEPELAEAMAEAARRKHKSAEQQSQTLGNRPGLSKAGRALRALATQGAEPNANEFDHVKTVLDLVFIKPVERLRITARTRVQDLPRSVHPAKQLHIIAAAIAPHAGGNASASFADLAAGVDSGSYLFEDLLQFDDYCRWCFMQRA